MTDESPDVSELLNAQTARIAWPELARHFARGVLVRVGGELDLLEIAESVIKDDAARLEPLFSSGAVSRATDSDAIRWTESQTEFWAVVVAPWVLVQEIQ